MFKNLNVATAASALFLSVGVPMAHADVWQGVPHPLFFRNGETVTPDMVKDQRGPVLDHCMTVAWQTIPSRSREILGRAFTTGLAGGLGEGAGLAGDAAVQGARLAKNAIPGAAVLGFLGNIFFGGFQGDSETNALFRSYTDACLARSAGGLYTMGPEEARQILESGQSHVVGVSRYWGLPHPAGQQQGAPYVPATPSPGIPPGTYEQPTY